MQTTTTQLVDSAFASVRAIPADLVQVHQYAGTALIIDVREAEELTEQGWIAGAVHVPRGMLEFWADPASPLHCPELDPSRPTVVYCSAGARSALAAACLQQLGYADVARLDGGIAAWKRADYPVAGLKSWHTGPTSPAPAGFRA